MKQGILGEILEFLNAKGMELKQSLGVANINQYIEMAVNRLIEAHNSFGYDGSYLDDSYGEIFKYKHHIKNDTLYFVFDIDKAISLPKEQPRRFAISEFDDFSNKNRFIYTKPNNLQNHKPKLEPLITIPFFAVRGKDLLVIDGNHRIAHAFNSSKSYLDCFIIDPMLVPTILRGKFESVLYLVQCDIYIIEQQFISSDVLIAQTCLSRHLKT